MIIKFPTVNNNYILICSFDDILRLLSKIRILYNQKKSQSIQMKNSATVRDFFGENIRNTPKIQSCWMINATFLIAVKVEAELLNNAAAREVLCNAIIIIRLTRDSFDLFHRYCTPQAMKKRGQSKTSPAERRYSFGILTVRNLWLLLAGRFHRSVLCARVPAIRQRPDYFLLKAIVFPRLFRVMNERSL